MKVQLFLIGLVAVLSLGAVSLADSPLASAGHPGSSPAVSSSPSPSPSESPDDNPSPEPSESPEASPSPEPSESPEATPSAHPCNHGFYVSQAAHQHKGGKFVSQIARSLLGKDGDCTKPLPTPAASLRDDSDGSGDSASTTGFQFGGGEEGEH